eukprot:scaffold3359_cov123-Cylindrotheca_fusiformis.AAC.29
MERSSTSAEDTEFFVYTSETTRADFPIQTLTHLRVDSSVREIPAEAFRDCEALVHVQLPETLRTIGRFAFALCLRLKVVEFFSNNASLETSSGNANSNLEEGTIAFPEQTDLEIENEVFFWCFSLRKVIACSVSTSFGQGVFKFCSSLFLVVLPEGLQVIEPRLFYSCQSLTVVKIPSSVIQIGQFAFAFCTSLTSVDLPHGLLYIGETSFVGCRLVETLQVPSTVTTIQRGAFKECGLKYIKLPPTLERIEDEVLSGCLWLQYIDMPSTVSFIGERAFYKCESLSHIRIPPSVDTIVPNTFVGCRSLISIELPEGIFIGNAVDDSDDEAEVLEEDEVAVGLLYSASRLREAGLNRKLKHRFDDSPLNKLCYYQSYHSSEDAMMQLRRLMEKDPLAATSQVDEFGMTPLHVLSLSLTPNLDMLLAVMNEGKPGHMVRNRDPFGCTPMDYLSLNRMPNSNEVIRRVLQIRFEQVLGLDQLWKSEMLQAIDEALEVDWSSRKREIGRVIRKFERKDILSFLELCLWKMKIDKVSTNGQTADREFCRVNSSASIVIPHVLRFLDDLDVEEH